MKSIMENKKVEAEFKKFYIFKSSALVSLEQCENIARLIESPEIPSSKKEILVQMMAKQSALTEILINEAKRANHKTIRAIEDNSIRSHKEVIDAIKKEQTNLEGCWNEFASKYKLKNNDLQK